MILSRRIGKTGFFHYGIVYQKSPVMIIEHDYDGLHLMTLEEFLNGETVFWRITYQTELERFGADVFRSEKERVAKAIALFREKRPYCPETFNCENFVRECVFKDPNLWYSPQIKELTGNEVRLLLKLSGALLQIAPEKSPQDGVLV